ncbi:MAG: hypothetical protein LBR60_01640 [Fibrobacter sp.]|jgi:hypothetical protein|nr:hypothetical protein [Fibrobacter sp.]
MVRFSQTSWFNQEKEAFLNLMRFAPLRIEVGECPLLHFHFPQGFSQGAPVRYHLVFGFQQIAWDGIIGCIQKEEVMVRLHRGPFRGFNACHSFLEEDGVLTCRASFSFQGEPSDFKTLLADTRLCYAVKSREKTAAAILDFETTQKTKRFEVLDSGMTG